MTHNAQQVKELFDAVMALPSVEREPFLDHACGNNDALRAEIESILEHHFTQAGTVSEEVQLGSIQLDHCMGEMIGKFKIISVLGEGGMGIVYLAEQSKPVKRRVALKVIKAGMDTKQIIARFEAERQALAIMDHPGISKVYEAGATDEGRPYFVLEYVKGMPITEACDEYKLDTTQRLELLAKVCDAVQHAHTKGIIHRDLKPSNIMVSIGDSDLLEPKIIDFGVAKATSQQLTEKTLVTQVGRFVGTPAYMSPEQADLKSIDIDTRTDVYALGVITYEVLSGVQPFDPQSLSSGGIEKMREIIRSQPPPRPSTQLSSLDDDKAKKIADAHKTHVKALAGLLRKELEWIPLMALRKQRGDRYDSAKSMGDDIRRYLKGDPLEAGPESIAYRFQKTLVRNKGLFATCVVVLLSLIVGLTVAIIGWQEATSQRKASEQVLGLMLQESSDTLNPTRETMKDILDDRLIQLEALQSEIGETPTLEHAIGLTYQHLGRWYKTSPSITSSQKKNALASYAMALKISNELEEYPEDKGVVLVRIGDFHKQAGNYELSLQNYVEAIPYLHGETGKTKEWLFKSKSNLVDVYEKLHRTKESFALAVEIVHDARDDLEAYPEDASAQRRLANRLQRLASTLSKRVELQGAIETQEEALGLYTAIANKNPTPQGDIDIAWANYFLGKYLIMSGESVVGLASLDGGMNLLEQSAIDYPNAIELHGAIEAYSKGRDDWIEHVNNAD